MALPNNAADVDVFNVWAARAEKQNAAFEAIAAYLR